MSQSDQFEFVIGNEFIARVATTCLIQIACRGPKCKCVWIGSNYLYLLLSHATGTHRALHNTQSISMNFHLFLHRNLLFVFRFVL